VRADKPLDYCWVARDTRLFLRGRAVARNIAAIFNFLGAWISRTIYFIANTRSK
jgi:hypothetical protein